MKLNIISHKRVEHSGFKMACQFDPYLTLQWITWVCIKDINIIYTTCKYDKFRLSECGLYSVLYDVLGAVRDECCE